MLSRLLFSLLAAILLTAPAAAQDREVPYWASLRADEVNMRVGPSADYPIDWVYKRQGLPVKVVRVMQGWRLVQDPDGTQGWIVARLLNPQRTAIVTGEGLAAMRAEPADTAKLMWNAEPGVVGKLGNCEDGWCLFDVSGREGWIEQDRLWGAGEP
ncbi:SH3 domain-containing protein [Paraurantiacibacter namhicola]|uniref:Bacterial SH3 domain protein n=1 Tax=Paraurantiacibacter namhicola TaxID=645517 RepID=A0A1C7D9Y0_9SPHN|nr:SH3 domain-containing protein [Paraurantiacibacter namhicola]ANU08113.1 Bacterial SH3 domain protein [Paraurantiacibacter namhicola]